MADQSLAGKVIFITGATRGVGREMALRFAKDGAKIVITGKTADPHPTLPGTIHTVAKEVIDVGGEALPLQLDVRDENQIQSAVEQTVEKFGGIDILINNASALFPAPLLETPLKRFDLVFDVNVRGTFACCQAAIPHLKNASNPHILMMSPPLSMKPHWFSEKLAYTISKYAMSMHTLGLSDEFKDDRIAVNSLWPKRLLATMAVKMFAGDLVYNQCRDPRIMADAAYLILTQDSGEVTGNFFIDEDILIEHGQTDIDKYALNPDKKPPMDFYID